MENANEWAPSPDHPGYLCKTIHRNACTITILRPELGEKEKQKREAHVKTAAENALKSYIFKGVTT
jgi:hypothetical protein